MNKKLLQELETEIVNAYESGTTVLEAEKLAAKFLHAQMQISSSLRTSDLDARMRKSGLKTMRSAIYLDIVQKNEKKPTEAQITAMIDTNELVSGEQERLDSAEVDRDELERYYNIFGNAHIFFRGVSKGRFE